MAILEELDIVPDIYKNEQTSRPRRFPACGNLPSRYAATPQRYVRAPNIYDNFSRKRSFGPHTCKKRTVKCGF
jgi:hypothetical protein